MKKEDINKVIEVAKKLEWNVAIKESYIDGCCFEFSKLSPAGQDFNISVDGVEVIDSLIALIYKKYVDFDVSKETYLRLDESGHGKNGGAPYDMKDLYEDMEVCQEMILDLYYELSMIQ